MTSLERALGLCGAISLAGCGSAGETEEPEDRVDLRAALEVADASAVGVTVDGAGRRFVLDQSAGLFELTGSGAVAVVRMEDMPDPGVIVELPYTDLAALGVDQFALTAIGDGFLLDVAADRQTQHFCYEPGDFPEERRQAAAAATYDRDGDLIYAQPQTFESGVDQPLASQIGVFDRATGFDLQWYSLPSADFRAGGMAVAPSGAILLGAGSTLHRFDPATSRLSTVDQLDRYGVTDIDGLAIDPAAATVLAIDAGGDQLVEIPLADLGL